jgi:DNA-binding transcriptional LysR family regulator
MCDEVLEAGRSVVGSHAAPSGTVRVAAPADFLDFLEVEWLAQFLTEHPRVRIELVLSDSRADLIGEGIDVAFRGGSVDEQRYVYRRLASQHLKLVASPAYLKARGEPQHMPDLAEHDCLVTGPSSSATWALSGPRGMEEARVSGRVSANTARALLKSCVAGLGIALLPDMLTMAELRAGRLIHVLPQYQRAGAEFCAVLPSRRQIPSAVAAFVAFATERLNSMIAYQEIS